MRVNSLLGISLKTLKTWELSAPATEFFFLLHQQVVGLCSKVMYLLHLLCDCNQPGWLNHLYMLSQYHEKMILLSLENKLYYVEIFNPLSKDGFLLLLIRDQEYHVGMR